MPSLAMIVRFSADLQHKMFFNLFDVETIISMQNYKRK
jgi:hypothetical protein